MNQKDVLKLFSYMITSARGCVDEPKLYGPFRLVDSIDVYKRQSYSDSPIFRDLASTMMRTSSPSLTLRQSLTTLSLALSNDTVIPPCY